MKCINICKKPNSVIVQETSMKKYAHCFHVTKIPQVLSITVCKDFSGYFWFYLIPVVCKIAWFPHGYPEIPGGEGTHIPWFCFILTCLPSVIFLNLSQLYNLNTIETNIVFGNNEQLVCTCAHTYPVIYCCHIQHALTLFFRSCSVMSWYRKKQ